MEPVPDVRRDNHDAPPPSLPAAGLLLDTVRRRIFRFVRRARRPVTRAEAAASARVSRNLAAFHLDRLVEAGLLRASDPPPAAGGRVGRRPKLYEPGPAEVHLDVPPRQHGLLASVLLEALVQGGPGAARAAAEAARRRGGALGRAAPERGGVLARARAALEDLGFEPYESDPWTLRLGNCPFHPVADESREIVCGLNQRLIAGLLPGIGAEGLEAILAPRAGECCVEVRAAGHGDVAPAVSPPGVVYVLVARVPESGLAAFEAYERAVLPLLAGHGGRLERRLRAADGRTEVHLVSFPSRERFAAYRDDPRRAEHAHLLAESGARTELFELGDTDPF
jgi:predicted ArsR family transcriptional regulator